MSIAKTFRDGAIVAKRNLIKIKRVPELLVFTTLSPIMFILLFAYVFGSAINVPGVGYREFLIPGIFAQTVIFGATITGAGLADDMQKGIIERFRSLPMSRSAVLVGRTGSDVLNNIIVIVVMSLTGLVCMLALGGVSTSIAYWLWGRLLRDYAAAQVVPFALLVPFVGSAASSVVFGERFGPLRLAGMVTVVGGIAIMLLSKPPQALSSRIARAPG